MPRIRGGFRPLLLPLLASFTMVRRSKVIVRKNVHIEVGGKSAFIEVSGKCAGMEVSGKSAVIEVYGKGADIAVSG